MSCDEIRRLLTGFAAGDRLDAATRSQVTAHVEGCAGCRRVAAFEAALDTALERLPRHEPPRALTQRLEAMLAPGAAATAAPPSSPTPAAAARRPGRAPIRGWAWAAPFVSACAAAALVLIAVRTAPRPTPTSTSTSSELVTEAINDHLRVVSSSRPVEIESGGIHQVKPWFTGRLDFAPRVAFSGDADFPLVGGAIGYFRDRKAAVFVFKRRLHTITLLVFPEDGLPWPEDRPEDRPDVRPVRVGALSLAEASSRGFSALLWRDAGLGYALVSDVNRQDLEELAARINRE